MKAQEREASNFLIQNLVSDAINCAVHRFAAIKAEIGNKFRLKLAIHDSIILACAGKDVPLIAEKVIPMCMAEGNVIPKLNFSFGVDMTAYLRWLVKPSVAALEEIGWPKGYKLPK